MSAYSGVNNDVASLKRKFRNECEASGSSSSGRKRAVPLQLFPNYPQQQSPDYPQPPQQQSPVPMSSNPAALHLAPAGHTNFQTFSHSFTSNLLNAGQYPNSIDDSVFFTNPNIGHQNPFYNLVNAQHEKLKEFYEQHYMTKYNDKLSEVKEVCLRRIIERDEYIKSLATTVNELREKVEHGDALNEMLNQVITNKNSELTYIRNANVELQLNEARLKSELQDWKIRAELGDQILTNLLAHQQDQEVDQDDGDDDEEQEEEERDAEEEEEDSAGELEVEEKEVVKDIVMACRVCKERVSTVMLWPCKHLCLCKHCDVETQVCPVCKCLKVESTEVIIP